MTGDGKLKECALFVVHYVPNLVRGESLNIGVFLHSPQEKYLGCMFTDDLKRIKHFHPQADLQFLRELQRDFEKQIDEHESDLDSYLQFMQRTFSNLIQVAEPRMCLLGDPQAEIQNIFTRYVGARVTGPPPEDTRFRIKQKLTAALSLAGVWDRLERRVPAARWTHSGDPFTFDYGYRPLQVKGKPNGHIHFIHAHSLSRDHGGEFAKVLVYTLQHVRREEDAELTAVVEGLAVPGDKFASLSQRILEEGEILLQPIAGVANYAQSVREELMM